MHCTLSTLERLRVLQNKKRVIRIITKSESCAHTLPLCHKYGLLDIVNIHLLQVGKVVTTTLPYNVSKKL